MRKKITLLLFTLVMICVNAQIINIEEVVNDTITVDVLPEVSIVLKGDTTGAEIDFDGNYTLPKAKQVYQGQNFYFI